MPHPLAQAIEMVTTALALAGMGYFLASLLAARSFLRERRAQQPLFSPGVSILKSLKGLDPGMMDAFRSHCRQKYAGEFELLFGVSSLDDPAAAAVRTTGRGVSRAVDPVVGVLRAARNKWQSEHARATRPSCALRFLAHQRFRHYSRTALSGAGDVLLCSGSA